MTKSAVEQALERLRFFIDTLPTGRRELGDDWKFGAPYARSFTLGDVKTVVAALTTEPVPEEDWAALAVDLRKELSLPVNADRYEITVAVGNLLRSAEPVPPDRKIVAKELANWLEPHSVDRVPSKLEAHIRRAVALLRQPAPAEVEYDTRNLAVELVDLVIGYTKPMEGDPAGHVVFYDMVEEKIAAFARRLVLPAV